MDQPRVSKEPSDRALLARVGVLLVGSLVVMAIAGSGRLDERTSSIVDNLAQFAAGLFGTLACWWSARGLSGVQRNWRLSMGVGTAGWTVGMSLWAWFQLVEEDPLPSPSIADLGFFVLPVMALLALLLLTGDSPRRAQIGARHVWVVSVLDALVVVGVFFMVAWGTSLGAVVAAGGPTPLAFSVALGYPVSDLVLVVMVVVLASTRRVDRRIRPQLLLLGLGLVSISFSDSIFAYLVANGAESMPHLANLGFVAGPAMIGLAATSGRSMHHSHPALGERPALVLPYALFAVAISLLAVRMITSADSVDPVLVGVSWAVGLLLMVRQALTVTENAALLGDITAAQAELAYRADHDPLTGLANRSLLYRNLTGAVAALRHGNPLTLLMIDLNGFKAINDRLGHATGDQLLAATADRLRAAVRPTDTVARLGGDEFVVLLGMLPADADAVAERIRADLVAPYPIDGILVTVGASVGVVHGDSGDPAVDPDTLMHAADHEMYAWKEAVAAHRGIRA
ncbi:GGDEF domain-containing protein [Skermania piniformis]